MRREASSVPSLPRELEDLAVGDESLPEPVVRHVLHDPVAVEGESGQLHQAFLGAETTGGHVEDGHDPGPEAGQFTGAAPDVAPARVEGGLQELDVPGFRPSVVFVPPGPADQSYPLAVATHGAGGMSEPHCENWSRLLRARAYVVCPRGTPLGLAVVPEVKYSSIGSSARVGPSGAKASGNSAACS